MEKIKRNPYAIWGSNLKLVAAKMRVANLLCVFLCVCNKNNANANCD